MKKIAFTLFLILIPALLYSQQETDYSSSLHVVYGNKNYEGAEDCSAECSLTSDGKNIIIKVEVTDDYLIFNNTIYSDHIELWFGLPSASAANQHSYITGSDKYLYHFQNKPNLNSMIAEIKNPLIRDITGRDSAKYYNGLSDKSSDQWLESKIDTYLGEARRDSLYKSYVFFGLTHFGINPGGGQVTFYDRENYDYLRKYLQTEIGDLNKYFKAKTKVSGNKYTAYITLNPRALGFVPGSAINQLKFLIDIVDCDEDGKQSSLLSTSKNRKWADINTFNNVKLTKSIDININPEFPFLGRDKNNSVIENEIRSRIYDTYVFTDKGWRGLQRTVDDFQCELYLVGTYTLPNIQRYHIEINDLTASTIKVRNREVTTYAFDTKRYIAFGDKLLDNDDLIDLFELPNGKLAAILYKKEWTHNGKWDISKLMLAKENEEDLLIGRADGINFLLDDIIHIDAEYVNSNSNVPWSSIRLIESSNKLLLNFKEKTFEVKWNDDAQNLQTTSLSQGSNSIPGNSQINDGLIGYWPFDGNAEDASGNYHNATPVGAVLTQDRSGKSNSAYYLDGHDDYLQIPHSDLLKPQFPISVAAWIRCDEQGGGILHTNYKEDRYLGVFVLVGSETDEIVLSYGCDRSISRSARRSKITTTPQKGTWFHFVGVIRGPRDMSIYINGLDAGGNYSGTGGEIKYDDSPIIMGKIDTSTEKRAFQFRGALDQIRIYNHALTDEEASMLYQSGQ